MLQYLHLEVVGSVELPVLIRKIIIYTRLDKAEMRFKLGLPKPCLRCISQ